MPFFFLNFFYMKQSPVYVNSVVIDARLYHIYKLILKNRVVRASAYINGTLKLLNTANRIDMPSTLIQKTYNHLYKALIDLALDKPQSAHNNIRELHYILNTLP